MTEPHAMVTAYLDRLDAATADLAPEVRDDLHADIWSHLDQAQREAVDEADLRTRIERLGAPEEIAAEARGGPLVRVASGAPSPSDPHQADRVAARSRRRDGATVVLLVFGALIGALVLFVLWPVGALLGWVAGVVMLWTSPSWTAGEKALGTLVWPGGIVTPLLFALAGGEVCVSESREVDGVEQMVELSCEGFSLPVWLGVPVMIAMFAAPIVVAAWLTRRADRRRGVSAHR